MKLFNKRPEHDHAERNEEKGFMAKVRQYARHMFGSAKCKNMSHGSFDIVRSISWPRGEEWRRNHKKSK